MLSAALVTWQLVRLALNSWRAEDVAPTPLQTPLWLPQASMGIGMMLLCLALVRTIAAKVRFLQGRPVDMSSGVELIVILAIFLGLLCVGMTIPFAILVPSVLYLLTHAGLAGLKGLGLVSWGSMNSFTLSAIPLFILMAEILQESKLSLRVYHGLSTLVAWMPGGLLQTNIAGCAIFAAISGSSVVTAASIGRVALPELQRRNYSPRLSAGSLAAGGTLGILIPPSIAMIVYGTFTETSVAKLFMAGVDAGPAADGDVHGLHRRARLAAAECQSGRDGETFGERNPHRVSRRDSLRRADRRHDRQHLFRVW